MYGVLINAIVVVATPIFMYELQKSSNLYADIG